MISLLNRHNKYIAALTLAMVIMTLLFTFSHNHINKPGFNEKRHHCCAKLFEDNSRHFYKQTCSAEMSVILVVKREAQCRLCSLI